MKFKVENLQLKPILTEEKYHSGFSKIENGDMFIVVTDNKTFNGEVLDKYGNQIIVKIDGKNFVITNNSLDGDILTSFEIENGIRKGATKVKGIKSIVIRRNGRTVTVLIPNNGRFGGGDKPNDSDKEQSKINNTHKEIYQEVLRVLTHLEKDNKLVIKTYKEIDVEDNEEANTITLDIHIRDIFDDDIVKGAVTNIYNDNEGRYSNLKSDYIKFSISQSLEVTENSVILICKLYKSNEEVFIEGIYEMHIGEFFTTPEPTFDELMQRKDFRDLMLAKPNLAGQISGELSKGVFPASEIIKKLGLDKSYYTRGKKVRFTYTGQNVQGGPRLRLKSGKEYIGMFSTDRIIKLTGEKRGESLLIKLKKKIKEQIYEVDVTFSKVVNGQQTTESLGRGIIQISDVNFR